MIHLLEMLKNVSLQVETNTFLKFNWNEKKTETFNAKFTLATLTSALSFTNILLSGNNFRNATYQFLSYTKKAQRNSFSMSASCDKYLRKQFFKISNSATPGLFRHFYSNQEFKLHYLNGAGIFTRKTFKQLPNGFQNLL